VIAGHQLLAIRSLSRGVVEASLPNALGGLHVCNAGMSNDDVMSIKVMKERNELGTDTQIDHRCTYLSR